MSKKLRIQRSTGRRQVRFRPLMIDVPPMTLADRIDSAQRKLLVKVKMRVRRVWLKLLFACSRKQYQVIWASCIKVVVPYGKAENGLIQVLVYDKERGRVYSETSFENSLFSSWEAAVQKLTENFKEDRARFEDAYINQTWRKHLRQQGGIDDVETTCKLAD